MESRVSCFPVCSQLLGFVYACYVVSAITEEEDSCEWLNTHTHTHSWKGVLQQRVNHTQGPLTEVEKKWEQNNKLRRIELPSSSAFFFFTPPTLSLPCFRPLSSSTPAEPFHSFSPQYQTVQVFPLNTSLSPFSSFSFTCTFVASCTTCFLCDLYWFCEPDTFLSEGTLAFAYFSLLPRVLSCFVAPAVCCLTRVDI